MPSGPQLDNANPPANADEVPPTISHILETAASDKPAAAADDAATNKLFSPLPAGVKPPSQLSAEEQRLCELVGDIADPAKRDRALHELSKKRESLPDLAPYLWYSFGTIAAFLQEIVAVYPKLYSPALTGPQSHRVCNCLALLQCIASHPETKHLCLKAHIPLYLYPFLNSVPNHRALEYLRLTALGVVGALVKGEDLEVLRFLLQSEIVPLCLRIMDGGSELSQTVATFIVQKVLSYDEGLAYLCATAERFYAVSSVLSAMLMNKEEPPSARLLKHIVRCYLRLCDNRRAREAFKHCLPPVFWTDAFQKQMEADPAIAKWVSILLNLVEANQQQQQQQPPINGASPFAGKITDSMPDCVGKGSESGMFQVSEKSKDEMENKSYVLR
eukprot:Gregarina_sp_Pseudo_9__5790@NODE_868_length_2119_cov_8_871154_g816_i0_p1_GENE_NODE_868_length_2119_cov_8_871154_g816_i0NODE_868_length_2119_cov_8_871154_g816_i0_p1_ORF_typecomplete_len388_score65_09Rcd1/PF04078_13/5_1e111RPN1_RPN2_N/PF17781_1/0_06_NODE_868_length_2119_cov_8_871154_g816_i0521215